MTQTLAPGSRAARMPLDIAVLSDEPLISVESSTFAGLRRFNLIMAAIHALSASVMLALSNDFSITVSSFFRTDAPGQNFDGARLEAFFDFPIAIGTVGFLYLSALFHLIVGTVGFGFYRRDIGRGMNRIRWVEYSLSSTLMIVVIALLPGIQDISALIAIAGANVAMILFGWLMETVNKPGQQTYWTPFVFGSIIGAVPWLAMSVYLFGSPELPTFVWFIFGSIFLFFNTFAVNQWLQYARVGRWSDYVFGERVYIVLSLAAKSALAWQIFGNTLAG